MAVKSPSITEFEHPTDYRQEITAHPDRVRIIIIPERRYLMIDGQGPPGAQPFADAIGSLYPVAYTLHFAFRRRGIEAPVGALEFLAWEGEPGPIEPSRFVPGGERIAWQWRLMLPVPQAASDSDIAAAIEQVRAKKSPPLIDRVRCETWQEGLVAQIMHVGPYQAEAPTIAALRQAIEERGLRPRGCHHEIYISDPNRTAPERLKTVIRHPVEWA
jgi:hypothetical protein